MFPTTFPILYTDNLVLREHRTEDKEKYFDIMSNPLAVRYFGRPVMNSIDQVIDEFEIINDGFEKKNFIKWGVTLRSNGRYIGSIGAWDLKNKHFRATLSCIIAPDYWGQKMGSEALTCVINFLFEVLKLHRLQVYVDPVNKRGMSFFQKIGFQSEGILRDYEYEYENFIDIEILSLINK